MQGHVGLNLVIHGVLSPGLTGLDGAHYINILHLDPLHRER